MFLYYYCSDRSYLFSVYVDVPRTSKYAIILNNMWLSFVSQQSVLSHSCTLVTWDTVLQLIGYNIQLQSKERVIVRVIILIQHSYYTEVLYTLYCVYLETVGGNVVYLHK